MAWEEKSREMKEEVRKCIFLFMAGTKGNCKTAVLERGNFELYLSVGEDGDDENDDEKDDGEAKRKGL